MKSDDDALAEVFTGSPGKNVPLNDTIRGFNRVGAMEVAEAQAELARAAAQLRAIEKLRQLRKGG
jgi:F0F1-type ATP synthase beta subunit